VKYLKGTKENVRKLWICVSWPRIETGTFRIRNGSAKPLHQDFRVPYIKVWQTGACEAEHFGPYKLVTREDSNPRLYRVHRTGCNYPMECNFYDFL
jgi:hypothetical protein